MVRRVGVRVWSWGVMWVWRTLPCSGWVSRKRIDFAGFLIHFMQQRLHYFNCPLVGWFERGSSAKP